MKAYVGQTRAKVLIRELADAGIGEITQPGEYPPRRRPWILDNGAYRAWTMGKPLDEQKFLDTVERVESPPAFVVLPDIVAGGNESLDFSLSYLDKLPKEWGRYLAVQDGMDFCLVSDALKESVDGLFVGGTNTWKVKNGEQLTKMAHDHEKLCHIGRVGTMRKVLWARRIGADSIDSSFPLWDRTHLRKFLFALQTEHVSFFERV